MANHLSAPRSPAPWRGAGIFCIAAATLLLALVLTRIFSVMLWCHFAFMAVSLAMFGLTVGAVLVRVWPAGFHAPLEDRRLSQAALLFCLAAVAGEAVLLQIPATFGPTWRDQLLRGAVYCVSALPFVAAGVCTCLVLTRDPAHTGALYAADLIGAGCGCAALVPLLRLIDGPSSVFVIAALGTIGSLCFARGGRLRGLQAVSLAALAVMTAAALWSVRSPLLRIIWAKGAREGPHLAERWNASSRVAVFPFFYPTPFGPGLSARRPPEKIPPQPSLNIDGDASTVITQLDEQHPPPAYLRWDITALGHYIRPHASVMIIGLGGGRDVLTALAFGQPRVVAVEVNGDILALLRNEFRTFTGDLESRPGIRFVHDDGRSFLSKTTERYDLIQLSLVDTFAATAAGAYVLSENALYTVEALRTFLDRLTPHGILSVSRWHHPVPRETLRMISLAAAALRESGHPSPSEHMYVAHSRAPAVSTVLVSPSPLTPEDLERLDAAVQRMDFDVYLSPRRSEETALAVLEGTPAAGLERLDLSPPRDDRPFFFYIQRMHYAFEPFRSQLGDPNENTRAVQALVNLAWTVAALSSVCIVFPLWLQHSGAPRRRLAVRLGYFAALGLGFILIELAQMQRLIILLGHPTYGLPVVLFGLLISAGLGSWSSRRVLQWRAPWRLLAVVVVTLLLMDAATIWSVSRLEASSNVSRILAALALLAPAGFLMGMPLPLGLAVATDDPEGTRALYWGVNGALSVTGAVFATVISLGSGISTTYLVGVAAYGVATVLFVAGFQGTRTVAE